MAETTEKIVVGVDGSEQSVEALRLAARLASGLGAAITVVGTWDYPLEYGGYVPLGSDNFDEITGKLVDESVAQAFGDDRPPRLSTKVIFGHASKVLVEESRDALMLIVGRRGHGGFRGLLMGSVSAACVSHATCPVLVTHGDTDADGGAS